MGGSVKRISIRVGLDGAPYEIHVGRGILAELPRLLARHANGRRAVVVTDTYLRETHAARVVGALRRAGWRVDTMALPRGERAKSFAVLERMYGFLLRHGVETSTPLVAVGGGTVGDAAGFAAATYHRGIPLVQVPTTLLAQVDSALGGKTGVNHPLAKNAIGAFHQPVLVVADVGVLGTLPRRQLLSGMAEVVKVALALDPVLARWLDASWPNVLALRPSAVIRVVSTCAAWKARIVEEDERERLGRRVVLNFGHTVGHALETAAGHGRLLHGEAVAWGMRVAIALSDGRGWLGSEEGRLARSLLARLPLGATPKNGERGKVLPALRRDKKVGGARNVFVLLRGLGRPVTVDDVTVPELAAAARRAGLPILEPIP